MYPSYFKEINSLDKAHDKAIEILPVVGFGYAHETSVLPALIDELPAIVNDYPVVFTDHETPIMVAVLGHKNNNFVDESGAWREGAYIPFSVRTYPFAGLADNSGEPVFCIDRSYEGIVKTGGEKVFSDDQGTLTPFGQNAANFAMSYFTSFNKSLAFTKKLKELDLFMPANVTVTKNGETFNFSGLNQINFQKLSALPAETIQQLIDSQEMYALYLHLYSLNKFTNVI